MNRIINFLGFTVLFLQLSCSDHKQKVVLNPEKNVDDLYSVYKIDSINNYYLIYALRKNIHYKIISQKKPDAKGELVKKGNYYDFKIFSILHFIDDSIPIIGSVGCIYVAENTKICVETEDSIYDVFHAKNIKGLYFENIN